MIITHYSLLISTHYCGMTHRPRGQNSFGQRMSGVSEASGSQVQLGWNQTLELSDLAHLPSAFYILS